MQQQEADAKACCLYTNTIRICKPREGLACTWAIYIDACDRNMKSWTQSGIASQAWVRVSIPIVIVVWEELGLLSPSKSGWCHGLLERVQVELECVLLV